MVSLVHSNIKILQLPVSILLGYSKNNLYLQAMRRSRKGTRGRLVVQLVLLPSKENSSTNINLNFLILVVCMYICSYR